MERETSPLDGVRVLELSHAIAGPHAGQMLADHGAEVIKIEPPTGEMSRAAAPLLDGGSVYFASHNRGKRSVCLDLKDAEGVALMHALIGSADVILTNYGVDVPDRLGFGYDAASAINPRIILAHITGFGPDAEWAPSGAYDGVIQAMSGIADLTGTPCSGPTFTGAFVADHVAAYHAVTAILFALRSRDRTGRGARLDISMLDSYQAMLAHEVGLGMRGVDRHRSGNRVQTAFANVFATADGAVFIAPLGEPAWLRFWTALGNPDVPARTGYGDSIGAQRDALEQRVATWAAERSTSQVREVLDRAEVPCGSVLRVTSAVSHMAANGRRMVLEVRAPGGQRYHVPGRPIGFGQVSDEDAFVVPALGEHTHEILAPLRQDRDRRGTAVPAPPAPNGGER